jgi:hypothetical protein
MGGLGVLVFGYGPTMKDRDEAYAAWQTETDAETAAALEAKAWDADDKAATLNTAGWSMFGAGAAVVVIGAVILGVNRHRWSKVPRPADFSWSLGGAATADAGTLALCGEW